MILEFLETTNANQYFMAQWRYIVDDKVRLPTFLFNQYLQVKSILYFNSIGIIFPFPSSVGHWNGGCVWWQKLGSLLWNQACQLAWVHCPKDHNCQTTSIGMLFYLLHNCVSIHQLKSIAILTILVLLVILGSVVSNAVCIGFLTRLVSFSKTIFYSLRSRYLYLFLNCS